jgi:hypothetical protein
MHVYMSKTTRNEEGKEVATDVLKYRGEAGPNDDPDSFKRLMEARGMTVHLSAEFLGPTISKAQAEA